MILLGLFCLTILHISYCQDIRHLPPCDNNIYCYGDLLKTVQMAHLFKDSKHFVDMSLRFDPAVVVGNFNDTMRRTAWQPSKDDLREFVDENFEGPGNEFTDWVPSDWKPDPAFLTKISDTKLRSWAKSLHKVWKNLGRRISDEVRQQPERHSLIDVPNPFIVPGGRFREFYYWDSYWVVKGLLVCEMKSTVRGMLENFMLMVERYGHIPNGGRVYYIRRSQPPFLIPMVKEYVDSTGDASFLRQYFNTMASEMDFWMTNRMTVVTVGGVDYQLARYNVEVTGPRPESYREDAELAEKFTNKTEVYFNLKSAAESGWDFSTRWFMRDGHLTNNIVDIDTRHIIPVDLNALLCLNARTLADFSRRLGRRDDATRYEDVAKRWQEAISAVLWDDESGVWFDYDLTKKKRNSYFFASNFVPFFADCYGLTEEERKSKVQKVLEYLNKNEVLNFVGGVPNSLTNSGQQWDFPNVWPPSIHMIIMGLDATGNDKARQIAFELAQKWVYSNYKGYMETGSMIEKYDVRRVGLPGGGGEYDVQLGFGWTNGVVLDLLEKYGNALTSRPVVSSVGHRLPSLATLLATCLHVVMRRHQH